jgi:hypothetical protein
MTNEFPPSDDSRYVEITAEIKRRLELANFGAGELLRQVQEEGIFGDAGSFEDYVWREFHMRKMYAYRLMKADKIKDLLKSRQCNTMPTKERQVRPLHEHLSDDQNDLRVLCWERA